MLIENEHRIGMSETARRTMIGVGDGDGIGHIHIAFVTVADLPEGGGNTTRLKSLLQVLHRSGHRVRVWNEHALGVAPTQVLQPRGTVADAHYEFVLGSTERRSGMASAGDKLSAVRAVTRNMLSARKAGALDVLWFNNLSFYDVAPLTWLARRNGIVTVQAYEDERLEVVSRDGRSLSRRLFALNSRMADRWCPRRADAVVTISTYLRTKYSSLVDDPDRVYLVPTIVSCDEWHLPEPPEEIEPHLLYVGAFGEQDDLAGIVDALALLNDSSIPFRATFLGANQRDSHLVHDVVARIRDRGIEDRVRLRGFVPLEEVRREIARSHVLLNIRRDAVWSRSGLSTKLSESLASGRLVVTAAVGDVPHYLSDGENALVVPAGASARRIAEALSLACTNAELRRRVGAAGREVARQQFDVAVHQRTLDTVLTEALHRRQSA